MPTARRHPGDCPLVNLAGPWPRGLPGSGSYGPIGILIPRGPSARPRRLAAAYSASAIMQLDFGVNVVLRGDAAHGIYAGLSKRF